MAIIRSRGRRAAVRGAGRADLNQEERGGETPSAHRSAAFGGLASWCSGQLPSSCGAPKHKQRAVAVHLAGLRERLLLNGTLQNVVGPIARKGFAVHMYMTLVDQGKGKPFDGAKWSAKQDPDLAWRDHENLAQYLFDRVEQAGGCLVCLRLFDHAEALPKISEGAPWDERLTQYLPRTTETGRNVLRLWKSREDMWDISLGHEKQMNQKYAFAMWTRDDTHWMRPISTQWLGDMEKSAKRVWSKDCMSQMGINDKTVLFGRTAAAVMLTAYSSFFRPGSQYNSHNAEVYLKRLGHSAHLELGTLDFDSLPGVDGVRRGERGKEYICVVDSYWCGGEDVSAWGQTFC